MRRSPLHMPSSLAQFAQERSKAFQYNDAVMCSYKLGASSWDALKGMYFLLMPPVPPSAVYVSLGIGLVAVGAALMWGKAGRVRP